MNKQTIGKNIFWGAIFLLFAFMNFSCALKITEEDIKKVENFDPQFKTLLSQKRNIAEKVMVLEHKITLEKLETDKQIEVIRGQFRDKKKEIEKEIIEVRKGLDPGMNGIKDKIKELNQSLSSLMKRLSTIENMLKNTKNLMRKSQETSIVLKDKTDWEREISVLEKEKEEINTKIQGIREEIALYELELRILRQ
ncbi:MAG: hypothetical protein NC818_02300 [Candidatus Omnitrophica bacterium]|nr:hypothetical protein [Candidatus Omnitrophota bacterium]